jgi:hypothetical protein
MQFDQDSTKLLNLLKGKTITNVIGIRHLLLEDIPINQHYKRFNNDCLYCFTVYIQTETLVVSISTSMSGKSLAEWTLVVSESNKEKLNSDSRFTYSIDPVSFPKFQGTHIDRVSVGHDSEDGLLTSIQLSLSNGEDVYIFSGDYEVTENSVEVVHPCDMVLLFLEEELFKAYGLDLNTFETTNI